MMLWHKSAEDALRVAALMTLGREIELTTSLTLTAAMLANERSCEKAKGLDSVLSDIEGLPARALDA